MEYRGFKIERTSTTVGKELTGSGRTGYLYKVLDANGHAERRPCGGLPMICSIDAAKSFIRDIIARQS